MEHRGRSLPQLSTKLNESSSSRAKQKLTPNEQRARCVYTGITSSTSIVFATTHVLMLLASPRCVYLDAEQEENFEMIFFEKPTTTTYIVCTLACLKSCKENEEKKS
jgi:hypothetical protein